MLKRQIVFIITLCCSLLSVAVIAKTNIIISETQNAQDRYAKSLLLKSLSENNALHYQIVSTNTIRGNKQALKQALTEGEVTLMWQATSNQLEEDFHAIKIPIYKGLDGYQIVFMNKDQHQHLGRYLTPTKLKKYTFGQLRGSESASTLVSNGLKIHTSNKVTNLVHMLEGGRFDMLPVSLLSFDTYRNTIEQAGFKNDILAYPVALAYKQPVYYFTNDAKLARHIERGLKVLIDSGEFDAYFYQQRFVQKAMTALNDDDLNIVQLQNKGLPKDAPIAQSHFWVDLNEKNTVVAQNQ